MTRPQVYLVEDYADTRLIVTTLLDDAGMAVTAVPDAAALTTALAAGPAPDLFLIDISLPAEDGFRLLRRLRRDPRWRGVPMVALTAHAMAGDAERGLAAGFDAYLTKPLDARTFAAQVRKLLPLPRSNGDVTNAC